MPGALARIRGRLGMLPQGGDPDAELRWWLETWEPVVRGGGYFPGDVLELLGGEPAAETYEGRRRQIARATVVRVLREAGIEDPGFFGGKVVADIGPGPLGFPDACGARVAIAVEPLAERFAAHGLLLRPTDAVYLAGRAERIPVLSGSVDVVVARNSLDHVADPERVVAEVARLLRPGGTFILNLDVDHPPTPTEPHSFTLEQARALVAGFETVRETVVDEAHGQEGRALIAVLRRP